MFTFRESFKHARMFLGLIDNCKPRDDYGTSKSITMYKTHTEGQVQNWK